MRLLRCLFLTVIFSSCTIEMINTNSGGASTDAVDASPATDIKADATIPVKAI